MIRTRMQVGMVLALVASAAAARAASDVDMLMQTASENKTEIVALQAQAAKFRQMGTARDKRIANLYGRWIAEHQMAGKDVAKLIKKLGGDPNAAKVLEPAPLGSREMMLHATAMAHMEFLNHVQMRYMASANPAVRMAMQKGANLSRKHMKQMAPYHNAATCPLCQGMAKPKSGAGDPAAAPTVVSPGTPAPAQSAPAPGM